MKQIALIVALIFFSAVAQAKNLKRHMGDIAMLETSQIRMDIIKKEILDTHNTLRRKHKVPIISFTESLNAAAQKHSNYCADNEAIVSAQFNYNNHVVGENLFKGYSVNGKKLVQDWYDEIYDYNFSKPEFSEETKHFTQIVWATTREIGLGVTLKKNFYYVVLFYFPAGNQKGLYAANVTK